ncbi:MAG TPA: hypothetical protein IAB06_05410 [Candidatus Avacidaminococcus intestinavium]|uniref:Uncharacterized protein n=1 Tax=Candidatus Avacidaminococcus intestinavium TaxID=2840684 RepID=A0A9D1MQ75_9FIRM|nr:hypothetical protein [Candidatus Avacidaminococcus intestinavium]
MNKELFDLINCPKIVIKPPQKEFKAVSGSLRKDLQLLSTDGTKRFSMFIRQNKEFPDNFSVGLLVEDEEGKKVILFRCNGPHGGCYNLDNPHFTPHIHYLDEERMSESQIECTQEYVTMDDAIVYFCRICNIQDAEKYFPFIKQQMQSLF